VEGSSSRSAFVFSAMKTALYKCERPERVRVDC